MTHWVVPVLLAVAIGLTACGQRSAPEPQAATANAPKVLRLGNGAEFDSLDPAVAAMAEAGNILRDVHEGLTRLDAEMRPIPGVAERWETSADGRTVTFHLRSDARWSNGDPVTSEDFRASWIRVVDPRTGSKTAKHLEPIVNAAKIIGGAAAPETLGVAAPDPRTLVVSLEAPTAYFPQLVAHWTLLPTHRGIAPGPAGQRVSNGAFLLAEVVPGSHTVLRRSPTYWDASNVKLDEVRYFQIVDSEDELRRFRAGDIDVATSVPGLPIDELRATYGTQLRITPLLGLYYYGFTTRGPPFNSRPLRQALSMVVDRERIVGSVMPLGQPAAYSWVPPGFPGYVPQRPEWASWTYGERVRRARDFYRAAGYGPEKPLRFELRYNTGAGHERIALAVAAMWKETLGAEAQPIAEDMRSLLPNIEQGKAPVFRLSWVADYPDPYAFLQVMLSTNGMNFTRFQSDRYDKLIRAARAEANADLRLRFLGEAEAILRDEAAVMPLYFMVGRTLVAPQVGGFSENAMRMRYSQDARTVATHESFRGR